MAQSWQDLLFAHWPVPAGELRRWVPEQLPLDTLDGTAWIAVTPFRLRGLRMRLTPPVPGLSAFPELNVRTYVTVGGRPGVYFLSLDAGSRLAVRGARLTYGLPYFHASMSAERRGGRVVYSSRRTSADGGRAEFRARYRPIGAAFAAERSSLEYFLTERYSLYTLGADERVREARIEHPPWPLQNAEAEFEQNTMTRPFAIDLSGAPLLHFAERLDVVIWPPRPLTAPGEKVVSKPEDTPPVASERYPGCAGGHAPTSGPASGAIHARRSLSRPSSRP